MKVTEIRATIYFLKKRKKERTNNINANNICLIIREEYKGNCRQFINDEATGSN